MLRPGLKALAESIVQSEIDEPGCQNFVGLGDTPDEEKQEFRDYVRSLRVSAGIMS